MPAALPEIGDAVFAFFEGLGISAEVVSAIGTILEYAAIAELLSAAQKALAPNSKSGVGANLETSYYSSEASIRIVYGQIKASGMQTIPPITYGAQGEMLASVLTLAGHEVDSITDAWFDSNNIPTTSIAAITGATSDGNVTLGKYVNVARIRRYTGTLTQNADWILVNVAGQVSGSPFTAAFRGRGIAYVATELQFDANIYTNVPNQTFLIQGKKVYDPRLDSTQPGGSGSQRVATPSTWAFSSCPALCLADYLMAIFGGEYDPSEIDWSTVMVAANVCDFVLTGSLTTPDGDQPRYACNGALLASEGGGGQPFTDNVQLLVNSMLGRVIYANGIWQMFAGSWQTTNTVPINQNDWASGLQITFEQGRAKRFNESHLWFIDPNNNWQRVECAIRSNATYQTADAEVIPLETDQPFCTFEKEGQRKSEFLLRQTRNQVTISGKLPPRFQGIKLWDTVDVNYGAFGWALKTFRVAGCTLNTDGSIDVSLAEEFENDWDDLLTAEYNAPSTFTTPASGHTIPSAPINLSISNLNGTISFDWQPGQIIPKGTKYQIVSYPGSLSNPSSKFVNWSGDATHVLLALPSNSPVWFQVQAFANSDFSAYNPNTFGVAITASYTPPAAVSSAWSAFLTGTAFQSGPGAILTSPTVTANVVNGTTPVYSWTNPGGMNAACVNPNQQAVFFIGSHMTLNEDRAGTWFCNIHDGSNVTSLACGVEFIRQSGA